MKLTEENILKEIEEFISKSSEIVFFEDSVPENAIEILMNLQITNKSYLGSLIYSYSYLIVQNGLIRYLGSGDKKHKSIIEWNSSLVNINSLIFANDVFGGLFAINNGDLEGEIGEVNYFSPMELEWFSLDCSCSDFLGWSLVGDVKDFYNEFRLNEYNHIISDMNLNEGLLISPYLWSKEFKNSKIIIKIIRIEELIQLNFEFKKNLT